MAYAFVQSAYATVTSGTANQATNSITVGGGHTLAAFVLQTTATVSGLTDTQSNTWTNVGISGEISGAWYLLAYLCQNANAGATVITNGNSEGYGIWAAEYSGLVTSGGALGHTLSGEGASGIGNNTLNSGASGTISTVPAAVVGLAVNLTGQTGADIGPSINGSTTNTPNSRTTNWVGTSAQSTAIGSDWRLTTSGTATSYFNITANQYDNFAVGQIILQEVSNLNTALDLIKIGTTPGDATGDPARVGGTKINDALISIYSARGARATTPGCFGVSSSAGTTTTLIDATQTWSTNQFAGQYVTITTGTLPSSGTATSNIAYSSLIASNTATTLTFAALPFATTSACGYDISPVVTTAQTDGQATSVGGTAPSTLVDASKSWTTNQWAGYVVTLLGGAYAGQQAPIASNTSGALTLSTAFASAIAAGTPYVIGSGQIAASQYATSGSTITVNAGTLWLELNGPTTMTVTFPSSPYDTQRLEISTTTAITSFATAGGTVSGAPSTMSANTGIAFRYHLGTTTWYRVQ